MNQSVSDESAIQNYVDPFGSKLDFLTRTQSLHHVHIITLWRDCSAMHGVAGDQRRIPY